MLTLLGRAAATTPWHKAGHIVMAAGYPESFLARLPVPRDVIGPLLSRLRSDDVYAQILHYPSPEHRSTALAQQVHDARGFDSVALSDSSEPSLMVSQICTLQTAPC
jgi:Hereditary spastic paraplegia protein strumpellin